MTLDEALQILELHAPFTRASLKKAYREAILVWHPDRFDGNPTLQAKAEARTCAVNEAYTLLSVALGSDDVWIAPVAASSPRSSRTDQPSSPNFDPERWAEFERMFATPPPRTRERSPARKSANVSVYIFGGIVLFLLVVGIGMYVEHGGQRSSPKPVPVDLQAEHQSTWKRVSEELQQAEKRVPKREFKVQNPNLRELGIVPAEQEPSPADAHRRGAKDQPTMLALPPAPAAKLVADGQLRHLPWEEGPQNGTVIANQFPAGGLGELVLNNGMAEDAYVKIITGGKTIASLYVKGGEQFTFKGIPDGTYGIMYRSGFGWDPTHLEFQRGKSATRFDRTLVYAARVGTEGQVKTQFWDVLSLTLHKVPDGNTTTKDISTEEFDRF